MFVSLAVGYRPRTPSLQPWRLQIEAPPSATTPATGIPIVLNNTAIATSGDWRRYFLHAGRRYAHTVDPRSGWALQNDLASVSVIHPQCMVADALSTALLCMGWDVALAFVRKHDIAALFMRRCRDANHDEDDIAVAWSEDFYRLAHPNTGGVDSNNGTV